MDIFLPFTISFKSPVSPFGPMLMLATNGTIGEVEEEPKEGE
jgi:hypothetical protein